MTITKFGHSCLLIEESGVRIVLDPGMFTTEQNALTRINVILITHEHGDHLSVDSVKEIVSNNPGVKIFTTTGVKKILDGEGIDSVVLQDGQVITERNVTFEGVGEKHAVLINGVLPVDNTGFIIAGRFFYPGDALTAPGKPVEILALPTAAPWTKLSEIVEYAIEVKPVVAFPIHDAILANPQMMQGAFIPILEKEGIRFQPIELGKAYEF